MVYGKYIKDKKDKKDKKIINKDIFLLFFPLQQIIDVSFLKFSRIESFNRSIVFIQCSNTIACISLHLGMIRANFLRLNSFQTERNLERTIGTGNVIHVVSHVVSHSCLFNKNISILDGSIFY